MLIIFVLVCKFIEDAMSVCYHFCEQEYKGTTPRVRRVFLRSPILVHIDSALVDGVIWMRNTKEQLNIPW